MASRRQFLFNRIGLIESTSTNRHCYCSTLRMEGAFFFGWPWRAECCERQVSWFRAQISWTKKSIPLHFASYTTNTTQPHRMYHYYQSRFTGGYCSNPKPPHALLHTNFHGWVSFTEAPSRNDGWFAVARSDAFQTGQTSNQCNNYVIDTSFWGVSLGCYEFMLRKAISLVPLGASLAEEIQIGAKIAVSFFVLISRSRWRLCLTVMWLRSSRHLAAALVTWATWWTKWLLNTLLPTRV